MEQRLAELRRDSLLWNAEMALKKEAVKDDRTLIYEDDIHDVFDMKNYTPIPHTHPLQIMNLANHDDGSVGIKTVYSRLLVNS